MTNSKIIFLGAIIIFLPFFLVLREPDLGGSLIFLAVALPIFYYAGIPLSTLFLIVSPIISMVVGFSLSLWILFDIILLSVLIYYRRSLIFSGIIFTMNAFLSFLTPFFWSRLRDYQQQRILTFLNPTHDVLGSGYQIIQSRIAVGSGGIFGKGFLHGTQKNLAFLPEQQTDFIFSVIGEEFGYIGSVLLLSLFLLIFWRCIVILKKTHYKENRLIIVGVISYLAFQIVVNVGMNIGIVPVVGIPLPFISYGGSSMLVNLAAMSIVVKIDAERSFIE